MKHNTEQWKPIPNTHDYHISTHGRLKRQNHLCKPIEGNGGYNYYHFSYEGHRRARKIARLVAEAFIGKRPKGKVIDHKDGNRKNDRLDNLQYLTTAANTKKGFLMNPKRTWKPPLDLATREKIKELSASGRSAVKIAKEIGCSTSAISKILNGVSKYRTFKCPTSAILEQVKLGNMTTGKLAKHFNMKLPNMRRRIHDLVARGLLTRTKTKTTGVVVRSYESTKYQYVLSAGPKSEPKV